MLKGKISKIPPKPGVYLFKDGKEKVLYVGKAKNLKTRLRTYFQKAGALDLRKQSMIKLVSDFSFIITKNELEALVLEANLIKQYKPRFNIVLRDDKNYPYLKLTTTEEWPRLEVVRKITRDGNLYFGPYVPSQSMWDALAFIRKNFPIRNCKYSLDKPMRPCIQYQMGRCEAPCAGLINRKEYLMIVEEVKFFLRGEQKGLLQSLERKMVGLSEELKFEEAAKIRDRMSNLKRAWESQRVVAPEVGDMDVIGYYSDGIDAVFAVFFIRNGMMIGSRDFYLRDAGTVPQDEIMHGFITAFYEKEIIPPAELIVGNSPEDEHNLKAWLKKKRGGKVDITLPQKSRRRDLLKMADENARQYFFSRKITVDETLKSLSARLGLPSLPNTIGALDVSTTSGTESVGAFIFWSGTFKKEWYRHIRIKSTTGIDDYAMIGETLERALKNIGEHVPDLLVVDGGRGQLETARSVIEKNSIVTVNGKKPMLIAIAKDPDRALTLTSGPVDLEDNSSSSLLLKKIRDEVHRFAITYHQKLRSKRLLASPLQHIKGIGKKRRLELLRHFGSIEKVRNAPIEEIAQIKGFHRRLAENLLHALRRQ